MKKLAAMLLAGVMALGLAACGGTASSSKTTSSTAPASSAAEEDFDITGKKIGMQTGTTGDIYVSEEDCEVLRYNSGFEAVQDLLNGKIDAVIIDDQPAKTFVEKSEGLQILPTAYVIENYAIAIAKDNNELTESFNKAIEELKKDGTLDKIVNYYINGEGETYTSPEGVQYDGELVMATNAQFPPYEFYNDENVIVGIDADFARAIGDKLGKEIKIEDMLFDSTIPAVTSGKADFVMAGMTVTDERKQSVNFTDSYYTGKQVIIVKK